MCKVERGRNGPRLPGGWHPRRTRDPCKLGSIRTERSGGEIHGPTVFLEPAHSFGASRPPRRRLCGWTDGDIFCTALPDPAPFNMAERVYFRRAVEAKGFAIGDYRIARLSGKPVLNFSYPVLVPGDLQAVLHRAETLQQREAERQRAAATQAHLTAMLEATTDFVATADPEGQVLYYNRAVRRMLGIGDEEALAGIRIPDAHPAWANTVALTEGIPAALQDGVWSGETAFLSRDGREIPVSQVILAHTSRSGQAEYLSTIARDITECKQAEADLRKSREQLRALAAHLESVREEERSAIAVVRQLSWAKLPKEDVELMTAGRRAGPRHRRPRWSALRFLSSPRFSGSPSGDRPTPARGRARPGCAR